MSLPVLFAVDENVESLRAIEAELLDRYGRGYRVVCVGSAAEAEEGLARLAKDGEDVALVIAGETLGAGRGVAAQLPRLPAGSAAASWPSSPTSRRGSSAPSSPSCRRRPACAARAGLRTEVVGGGGDNGLNGSSCAIAARTLPRRFPPMPFS